jgi:hypothetical protein
MDQADSQFYDLLEFVLDGSCSDAQREEFSRLVEANPEWTPRLAEDVFIHSLLQWHSQDVDGDLAACCPSDVLQLASGTETMLSEWGDSFPRPFTERRSWFWAAAAVLLVAAIGTWQIASRGRDDQRAMAETAVAEIVSQDGVAWFDATTARQGHQFIVPGRLETTAGSFTLRFRSGPVIRVKDAVSMMIESDRLVHLDRGQATARVTEESIGFTIRTPMINVIDQGTEFGVAVRQNGLTDVIVFDGKVDLEDRISSGGPPKRLIQGEAARVDRQGDFARIMQVSRDVTGSWWMQDYPSADANVIAEVRDNIPPSDGSKYFCYQIAYCGLDEDVFAYADHPHQWNGLTTAGMPSFLRGADYVKTFNDYRYLNDFEMVVTLAQPANLYVFFDDRVPPPSWLTDQFEDSGFDIGLDEGPWAAIDQARWPNMPVYSNGVGAGKSIENRFSIWVRSCDGGAEVTLGLMGEEAQARAMYGIAATPLDEQRIE